MTDNQETRVVAHRGASHDAPENTLAAFQLAWQQDADAIETDVFLTSDRQIVCIHDQETSRLAGQKWIVEDSSAEQLRALDVGDWKASKWKGERVPILNDVLDTVPVGKGIVIELKSGKQIAPVLAAELSKCSKGQINVLIITFDEATAVECKTLMPQYPLHWLTGVDQTTSAKKIAETVRRTNSDGVGMEANAEWIDADFIAELKRHGCDEFHVWTVDDVADAKYFRDLGAAAITTNKPAVIGAALRE